MTKQELAGTTAIVTGASRGFGRATVIALAASGAHVVGVARSAGALNELKEQLGDRFTSEVADVTDGSLPHRLYGRYEPQTVILNAGAMPEPRSLRDQTWENFSTNWEVDVRQAFDFSRAALLAPLRSGSVVISLSSGAALKGSPLSGGYAGAKATVRFVTAYAASEAERGSLGIRFVSVLPQLTPATDLGAVYVQAYAEYEGRTVDGSASGALTPEQVGQCLLELATNDDNSARAYLLSAAGLSPAE
jgi:NAD(P)-dependent dehydrogenase (short-subunit alcohol dehydrogenase family)